MRPVSHGGRSDGACTPAPPRAKAERLSERFGTVAPVATPEQAGANENVFAPVTAAQRFLRMQLDRVLPEASELCRDGVAFVDVAAVGVGLAPQPLGTSTDDCFEGHVLTAEGAFIDAGLASLTPVTPKVRAGNELVVFLNGVATGVQEHLDLLATIADRSGLDVIGLHNATSGVGFDVGEVAGALAGFTSRATAQTAGLTLRLLDAERPFLLAGHSQGGQILADALRLVHKELLARGLTPGEALDRMATIKVETYGSTGFRYPDGPQYVHYHNAQDAVPSTFNRDRPLPSLGKTVQMLVHSKLVGTARPQLGADARVVQFDDVGDGSLLAPHRLETYLAQRLPFDHARVCGRPSLD
jgi:hypothetical protein